MKSSVDLTQALDVARQAAQAGADIAMRSRASRENIHVKEKGTADWVTDVDFAAQAAVISVIRAAFPDHRILAEEEGTDVSGDPSSPYQWIVDPLDGTVPYIHGKNTFGCIVSLRERETILTAATVLPALGESFWAQRGGGAYFNGRKLKGLRATRSIFDAILCTNQGGHSRGTEKVITFQYPRCASLQNYGCAAAEIGDILKGQNDGCFFDGVKLWDIAAGCLFAEEAGGRAIYALNDPANEYGGVRCVISTKPIFEELCAFVFRKPN